jgi:hypothetical protein
MSAPDYEPCPACGISNGIIDAIIATARREAREAALEEVARWCRAEADRTHGGDPVSIGRWLAMADAADLALSLRSNHEVDA